MTCFLGLALAVNPGDHSFTMKVGELDRHYTVHVPANYDGKTPVPVVVMLHGGGGTSKGAATETGWSAKADKEGFLAVFPDAMARDPAKPGSFARNPQLWNDGSDRFYPGQNAPDDVAFLNAMLDELVAKFAADARRIYVTGFSNGASMCFRFGTEASRRITAIAPVAGACWLEKVKLERPVPMCYLTGTADPLNLIEGGVPRLLGGGSDKVRAKPKPPVRDSIRKWTDALGCSATPTSTSETNGVHIERYGTEVVYVTVAGQGHTWAGGKSLLPEFMVGKTTDKLNATDFIWEFFQKHAIASAAKRIAKPGDYLRELPGWPDLPYDLHIPTVYDPARPVPVVLAIHGGGGNSKAAAKIASPNGDPEAPKGLNRLADREGFLVVYPNGTSNPLVPSIRTWNAGGGKAGYEALCGTAFERKADEIGYFRAVLDDLEKAVNVDRQRVYATGISNGAAMCYRLAHQLADRIAAIAPVAGGDQFSAAESWLAPPRPLSVLHIHGTEDMAWPFNGGQGSPVLGVRGREGIVVSVVETISHWVSWNGCGPKPEVEDLTDLASDGTTVTRETYTSDKTDCEVVLLKVKGGGHTWPQGYQYVPERRAGRISQDFNANEIIWEFFKKHPVKKEAHEDGKRNSK